MNRNGNLPRQGMHPPKGWLPVDEDRRARRRRRGTGTGSSIINMY
ncbi:hypothetical protein KNP414_06275 [Paenibacillus mucilaginosus KNP414]|uniref:Uncharacterized protein n=1 Tax=Paenibacillus mucilaginosus (strain KNP414) TaxID=1036673 RepID=F8FKB6_PAEMK|nr:hypothetical protein KNP414_06275 [Paenibacillus mucilaginosus KNP414]